MVASLVLGADHSVVCRRWVTSQLHATLGSDEWAAVCDEEMRACARFAEAHPKLYFAWTHRLRVCRSLPFPRVSVTAAASTRSSAVERLVQRVLVNQLRSPR